jgi:hypothetical protein
MEEIIKAWLRGSKNYIAGVALFKLYGNNHEMLQFFLKGVTPFRQQRLQESLSVLVSDQAPKAVGSDVIPDALTVTQPTTTKSDPKLLEMNRQKVILSREKDELRAALEDFETDQERGEAAFRILEIRHTLTGIWEIEEYYKTHGRLPVNSDHLITDLHNLKHHRSRINGNLRRIRSQLKKAPYNVAKKELLAKWEAEYAQIKQSIKTQQEKK